jgi:hypothetical protein
LADIVKDIPSTDQITYINVKTLNGSNETVDMPSGFPYSLTVPDIKVFSDETGWDWNKSWEESAESRERF